MIGTAYTEILSRSRLSLDAPVREALEQGRTVRSRNRDLEYAIVLSDNPIFREKFTHVAGVADARADLTIVVTDFTFRHVAKAAGDGEPDLRFYAPVIDREGDRVGSMTVNASPYGNIGSDQGRIRAQVVFFTALKAGDLFCESPAHDSGQAILFRATADATASGRVEAESIFDAEPCTFDIGVDYLVFKVVEGATR